MKPAKYGNVSEITYSMKPYYYNIKTFYFYQIKSARPLIW